MLSSEIRIDPLTGKMVIVAGVRGKRPHGMIKRKGKRKHQPISRCPFENPQKSGNPEPLFIVERKPGEWSVQVIPNKYPALTPVKLIKKRRWLYEVQSAGGYCEVVITRDHRKFLAELDVEVTEEFLLAIRERYRKLKEKDGVHYIFPFVNYGPGAGASLTHPHGQIIALNFTPPRIKEIMRGARRLWLKNKKCFYCDYIKWEKKQKKRIITENKEFISLCPFISTNPYEIEIFPKYHSADFSQISDKSLVLLAKLLRDALKRLYIELNDPDYNLFLYSSFLKKQRKFFHWQIHIIPATEAIAGFELSSGMEVCGLRPAEAAQRLRKVL